MYVRGHSAHTTYTDLPIRLARPRHCDPSQNVDRISRLSRAGLSRVPQLWAHGVPGVPVYPHTLAASPSLAYPLDPSLFAYGVTRSARVYWPLVHYEQTVSMRCGVRPRPMTNSGPPPPPPLPRQQGHWEQALHPRLENAFPGTFRVNAHTYRPRGEQDSARRNTTWSNTCSQDPPCLALAAPAVVAAVGIRSHEAPSCYPHLPLFPLFLFFLLAPGSSTTSTQTEIGA